MDEEALARIERKLDIVLSVIAELRPLIDKAKRWKAAPRRLATGTPRKVDHGTSTSAGQAG